MSNTNLPAQTGPVDLVPVDQGPIVSHTTKIGDAGSEPEPTPTDQAYSRELNAAYEYFNRGLFAGALRPCLITLPRRKSTYGYFSPQRFENATGRVTDEIALNPDYFKRPDRETLSTLVHEMVHVWQAHFGKPSRAGYHNREWAAKMEAIGLMPSDTGQPGGRCTGQQMSHYIIDGGLFDRACKVLLDGGFAITWKSATVATNAGGGGGLPGKAGRREKYICRTCSWQLWGKPGGLFICINCIASNQEVPPEIMALCMEERS